MATSLLEGHAHTHGCKLTCFAFFPANFWGKETASCLDLLVEMEEEEDKREREAEKFLIHIIHQPLGSKYFVLDTDYLLTLKTLQRRFDQTSSAFIGFFKKPTKRRLSNGSQF